MNPNIESAPARVAAESIKAPTLGEAILALAPGDGEAAVLSLLAARDEKGDWLAASGSLLSVPEEAARISWPAWERRQPQTRGPDHLSEDVDLGAMLDEEPFPKLRMMRLPVGREEWRGLAEEIDGGEITVHGEPVRLARSQWSPSGLYSQDGQSDGHRVLRAARRPVSGVVASLEPPPLPFSDGLWSRGGPAKPVLKQTREELAGHPTFANWPTSLLGIGWTGGTEFQPPPCFVMGKAVCDAWIADAIIAHETDLIHLPIGWDAEQIDPLGCSIIFRCERDGVPLLVSQWRVSDLPAELALDDHGREARQIPWKERTLSIVVPRGPRYTEWGVSLLGPDGALLDELDVARRVERIELSVGIAGAEPPPMRTVAGDPRPQPDEDDIHRALLEARELERETRQRAAQRRLSTAGELREYLRWRFSAREGELQIIDRYLLDGKNDGVIEAVIEFLVSFNRPIRALVSKPRPIAAVLLASHPGVSVRRFSRDNSHDRIWIVGETGVSVGASPNQFLGDDRAPATTALDLPFADSANWAASRFAAQWQDAEPLT
jgi:hypothetical protein